MVVATTVRQNFPDWDGVDKMKKEKAAAERKERFESGKSPKRHKVRPPTFLEVMTTPQQIRAYVIEGKNSLFNNLPHPHVKTCGSHAYVLPSDVLADFMGHGLYDTDQPKDLHPVQPLSCSPAAMKHRNPLKPKCIEIFGGLWSDGFEPNYTVANRGSAWIMTMSLESKGIKGLTAKHVYPVAIGKESDDHREVEHILWRDIRSITGEGRYYDGKTDENQDVNFQLLTIMHDQPE